MNSKLSATKPNISKFSYEDAIKAPIMNLSIFARKRCKVKSICQQKTKDKKSYYNENNFI